MTEDGFLRTGDIGYMDERGYTRIVDRKKDLILVSGFNVYPNEIEDVVALHPGVLEVAAVGVPDEKSGEAVKIVVVKKDPALTAEALIAHCRQYLTGYKVPRRVELDVYKRQHEGHNDSIHGYYLEDLKVGMSASHAKTVTETDVVMFAGLTGDNNPVHCNEEFAAQTRFKGRIAHGMFCAGLISCVAGTRLPGPGAVLSLIHI